MTVAGARAAAPSAQQSGLERAIEALRAAMVAGDGQALNRLLHDRLSYMHSSGNAQTKADVMRDLGGKRFFAALTYPEQTVSVVDRTGLVIQTVDQVKNLPDGKTRASRIKVQQAWVETDGGWKLLARSSAIISSPLQRACAPGVAPPG